MRLFVCGPTVYDLSHIGHGRTFLAFDLVARYLRFRGYRVTYVKNITDIDDKIIDRARKTGRMWKNIAREFERAFLLDLTSLRISSIDRFARASDFLPEILTQIKTLMRKKAAYVTTTGVYFHVPAFPRYGALSGQKLSAMRDAVRIEPDPTKRHPADFALWKFAKPGEPSWPSPWGRGRPGWHIEDTAITHNLFGLQYDLHGGALDLIFPHHEAEIAQMEAAYGKHPFVKYWMHAGFLNVRGEKMAKSLGNFITIRELLEQWPQEVFRMFVYSAHYRSPLDYDADLMAQAASSLERISQFVTRLESAKPKAEIPKSPPSQKLRRASKIQVIVREERGGFLAALDDDFDTPRALAALFDLVRRINPIIEEGALSGRDRETIVAFLNEINAILGILPAQTRPRESAPLRIRKLVERREAFRKAGRFAEADAIRKDLTAQGWQIEDTTQGPRVKRAR